MDAVRPSDERASCGRRGRVVLASRPFLPGKTHIRRAKAPQKAPFHRLMPLRPFGTVWLDTGQGSPSSAGANGDTPI
jgi:hypothetical protein